MDLQKVRFYPEIRKTFGQTPQMHIFWTFINSDFTTCPSFHYSLFHHKTTQILSMFALTSNCKMIPWNLCTSLHAQLLKTSSESSHLSRLCLLTPSTINCIVLFCFREYGILFSSSKDYGISLLSVLLSRKFVWHLEIRQKDGNPFFIWGLCFHMYCLRKSIRSSLCL